MKEEDRICSNCHHYQFFDSGYGNCFRNPATLVVLGFFKRYVKEMTPMPAWNRKACGEFRLKGSFKRK